MHQIFLMFFTSSTSSSRLVIRSVSLELQDVVKARSHSLSSDSLKRGAGASRLMIWISPTLVFRTYVSLLEDVVLIQILLIALTPTGSNLTIIPQDPTILSGTLRSTLDIFNDYEDNEIYDALRRVHLLPPIGETPVEHDEGANKSPFESLDGEVSEGGGNFSQGQRQLLCVESASAAEISADSQLRSAGVWRELFSSAIECSCSTKLLHLSTMVSVFKHKLLSILDLTSSNDRNG